MIEYKGSELRTLRIGNLYYSNFPPTSHQILHCSLRSQINVIESINKLMREQMNDNLFGKERIKRSLQINLPRHYTYERSEEK